MGRTSDARQRLIEGAAELIHTRGYNAVGVNELCEQAGVKKGSFYHFFPSKVALVEAVLEAHLTDLRALARDRTEATPLQRLVSFVAAVREGYVAPGESGARVLGCPIGNLAGEMSTQEEQIRLVVERCYREIGKLVAGMLDEAVSEGELPACDTADKALELMTYMQGAALMAKAFADPAIMTRAAEALPRLLGANG